MGNSDLFDLHSLNTFHMPSSVGCEMKIHTDTDTHILPFKNLELSLWEGELAEGWRNEIKLFPGQSINPGFGFQNYDSEALLILVCLVPELCSCICACLAGGK